MKANKKTFDRWFPSLIAMFVFLVFAIFYIFANNVYFSILREYGFGVWKYPFLDLEAVPAALECWHKGIDVYVVNPCDSLGRSGVYSPIWLWLPAVPTGAWWTAFYGICVSVLFFLSLVVLPPGKNWKNRLFIAAALISPYTVFAVERGNVDLVIFAGCALFILLIGRSAISRQIGYTLALLLGLLKWYPLPLLCLIARERLRVALATSLVTGGTIMAFILTYHTQIAAVLRNVPAPDVYYGHGIFGSPLSAEVLADILETKLHLIIPVPTFIIGLELASIAVAASLAMRAQALADLSRLDQRQNDCLLVGGLLTCGCFLTGVSVGYRAIFLIFILPSVLALSENAAQRQNRRLWLLFALMMLTEMWILPLELWVRKHTGWISPAPGVLASSPTTLAFLVLREGSWWVTVTLLLAIIFRMIIYSTALEELRGLSKHMRHDLNAPSMSQQASSRPPQA